MRRRGEVVRVKRVIVRRRRGMRGDSEVADETWEKSSE
jgi:hypothetical protein